MQLPETYIAYWHIIRPEELPDDLKHIADDGTKASLHRRAALAENMALRLDARVR